MDKKIMETMSSNDQHLVLVPCPLQGHINPMLHLADVLRSRGFSITIIHPKSIPIVSSSHHDFLFESIEDGLSEEEKSPSGKDVISFLFTLNSKCKAGFRNCLARIIADRSRDYAPSIIFDAVMYSSVDVAAEFKIPKLVLRTSTAANFLGLSLLNQKGSLPDREQQREKILEGLPSVRFVDMPIFNKSGQDVTEQVLTKFHEGTKEATAIIWNTFEFLEHEFLEKIEATLSVPIFPIGPIHKHSNNASSFSLMNEDKSCFSWLDSQTPNSVLYVSTGSLIALTECELMEMAWGLAGSDQPFLWVIRPGLVKGTFDATKILPKEFREAIKGRSKIVEWAPQQEVLAHESIGCFWTRNGWNSTMESICEGVPMLCWPYVGDQRIIAGFVSQIWKVGIQLDGEFERGNIANTIKRLMVSEEGKGIKERAMLLKEKVELSLKQQGSSCQFLSKLVDYIQRATPSVCVL